MVWKTRAVHDPHTGDARAVPLVQFACSDRRESLLRKIFAALCGPLRSLRLNKRPSFIKHGRLFKLKDRKDPSTSSGRKEPQRNYSRCRAPASCSTSSTASVTSISPCINSTHLPLIFTRSPTSSPMRRPPRCEACQQSSFVLFSLPAQ